MPLRSTVLIILLVAMLVISVAYFANVQAQLITSVISLLSKIIDFINQVGYLIEKFREVYEILLEAIE